MTRDEIAGLLPLRPRRWMKEAVRESCAAELGPELCLYWRESSIMAMDDGCGWPELEPEITPRWSAHCHCGSCGNDWHSEWLRGGDGILIPEGEDGTTYTGLLTDGAGSVQINEGESFVCPWCGKAVMLTRKQSLKSGRTYRIRAGSLENAGPFTAVVCWMAERYLASDGGASVSLFPTHAAVIDGGGGLLFYAFDGVRWKARRSNDDPFQIIYYSYDGNMSRKVGAWLWGDVPEMLGQTGEKTGIAEYFRGGGQWPVMYLRFWRGHPNAENLVKAGWLCPLERSIDEEVLQTLRSGAERGSRRKLFAPGDLECLADWSAAQPSDMLGMMKEEVRKGAAWYWDAEMLGLWMGCVDCRIAFPGDAEFLDSCWRTYGLGALQRWADKACEHQVPASLEKIDRYLRKQAEKRGLPVASALTMYLDYLDMLDEDADELSPEQAFPPDLRAAHDRAAVSKRVTEAAMYAMGFRQILDTWAGLEWSDGEICAVLPRGNYDLVAEGKVLHHCVGGYGEKHVKGSLIVFIRHARRPERSWFTLNIDLRGKSWKEVQLHGYGNEFAHGKHLSIPKRVRDFVDRWEREVLTPVFRKVRAAEKRGENARKKAAGAA